MRAIGVYALIALVLGLIPGVLAHRKGWPFVAWWIYGTLLFVIALPHSIVLKRNSEMDPVRKVT